MRTIVCVTTKYIWEESLKVGRYTHSTITSTLEEVSFIHATSPDQTMDVIQRFTGQNGVILLMINVEKVKAPVKYEPARSGRPGLFPHIYGMLNTDAVYSIVEPTRDSNIRLLPPPTP